MFLVLLRGLPTKENFFPASLLLPRAILRYFWAYFGVCSSSFESCLSSYLIKFYPDAFCITLIVSVLRKISQHLSLCWGTLCNILGAYFGYITQCLEKRVTFSWYFVWIFWCYCGGHQTQKVVGRASVLNIFGYFWSIS